MRFALEENQGDEWINLAYAEFPTFEDAQAEGQILAAIHDIDWDTVRVRVVDTLPMDDIEKCECGGPLRLTSHIGISHCADCDSYVDYSPEGLG